MEFLDAVKIIIIGIIEGITEWLPISSTGHIMLFEHFFPLSDAFSEGFKEAFDYVIQLGAIIAVPIIFWGRLFPFKREEQSNELGKRKIVVKPGTFSLWGKVVVACIPAVIALVVDKLFDKLSGNARIIVIAAMLMIYGVAFIIIERLHKNVKPRVDTIDELSYKDAFLIGLFQVLAAVPGTSRSGVTIIGGLLIGTSRLVATEFTFFLAIPVMVGASGYKLLKFALSGASFTSAEISALILGSIVALAVSVFIVKFLTDFVKKHDFTVFGWYRIVLGALVLILLFV